MDRGQGKAYCSDCWLRTMGRHSSQTDKMNKLGFWSTLKPDEVLTKADEYVNAQVFDDCGVAIYRTGATYPIILEVVNENGREVARGMKETFKRSIFTFFYLPSREDVRFILDQYKRFGYWPEQSKQTINCYGHKDDCLCPTCR